MASSNALCDLPRSFTVVMAMARVWKRLVMAASTSL